MTSIKNAEFLAALIGEHDGVGNIAHTSFALTPEKATGKQWGGNLAPVGSAFKLAVARNNYFGAAIVRNNRDSENFVRMFVLVLDDAHIDKLQLPPTYKLETSADNFQVGYALIDTPETRDFEHCKAVIKAFIAQRLMSDKAGNNVVRWVRLPRGSNTKAKNQGDDGKPFACTLREWHPDRRYSLDDIMAAYSITLERNVEPKPAAERKPDLREMIHSITTAAPGMHDAIRDVGAKFVAAGAKAQFIKTFLHSIACDDGTDRTAGHIRDIDRSVDSAVTKFASNAREVFQPSIGDAINLMREHFEPLVWVIAEILPEGIYILAAAPKVGKSWWALQMARAVASGGKVLGFQAKRGEVLYMGLEDSPRRMQSRMKALGENLDAASLSRLHFTYTWPRMNEGGGEALDEWLAAHPDCRLVVIDLLENIRPPRQKGVEPYAQDYAALMQLREIAKKHHVAIVPVHHTRKADAADALDMISGTQGLVGGADGAMVIKRPRAEERGELHAMGRDLETDGAYVVSFKRDEFWQMVGPKSTIAPTETQDEVLRIIRETRGSVSLAEILATCGRERTATMHILRRLCKQELIVRTARGRYALALDDNADLSVKN